MSALPKPIADLSTPPEPPHGAAARLRHLVAGARDECRRAPYTVRLSVICLLVFYLFAAASPLIAPYDPTHQYRNLPDCPPMRLHLAPPSQWSHGFFFAYPLTMTDAMARRFAEDRSRRTWVRLFHRGHLFTTESAADPYFMLGSENL